jgi:Uma2 family endonuclease
MTLRAFEAFDTKPDEKWELIGGELHMTPSASSPHNDLAVELRNFIRSVLTPADGWYVTVDTSLRLAQLQSEVRPDVAVYRQTELKDRLRLPIRVAPKLAVECLSPGNIHHDLHKKLKLYHKAGIPEYWAVDPKTGAIILFVLKRTDYEQLVVDPKGFIESPLLKRKLRIIVKPWTYEIVEG